MTASGPFGAGQSSNANGGGTGSAFLSFNPMLVPEGQQQNFNQASSMALGTIEHNNNTADKSS